MAIWRGAIVGLVGGVVAAGAMSLAHKGLIAMVPATRPPGPAEPAQDEDATVKVAAGIMRRVLRRPLPEHDKPIAGEVVHYAFGGTVGALYGAAARVAPRVTMALGVPFGAAVWLGAHVIMVPTLGLAPPPTRQPPAKEAGELVLHLVYGAVTELVRRRLHRVR